MISPRLTGLVALLPLAALAQPAPAPTKPKDAIRNGSFERTLQTPNLWGGVDRDGALAGFRTTLAALNESGNIADMPMPVSVAIGDLNGDGLPDLLTSDPLGYIRIYFNSGTREAPKFTVGELTMPFLALPDGEPSWEPPGLFGPSERGEWLLRWSRRRQGVRVGLADTSNTGKLDLVAGNYFGEIFFIPNRGSVSVPQFSQPSPLAKGILPLMKDPNIRWGNIFAPLLYDWDGDSRVDLLVGEGSYSANSIHLLPNQGSSSAPSFSADKRQPLALGEGREQLTPALADVNGDGKLDLLVSDRRGRVTAYLRPANWKPGDAIPPSGFLAKNGGLTPDDAQALVLGSGIHTIAAGDLNGDGLFDLVTGRSNGRVAAAFNKGTKEQPKFDVPTDLQGTKPTPVTWMLPSQWDVDVGIPRGNFFAYATCVSAQEDPTTEPKEGTRALKFGFAAPSNQLLPRPTLTTTATRAFDRSGVQERSDALFRASAEVRAAGGPNNFFILRQPVQMEIGKTYTLSFQVKGSKVSNGTVNIGWRGFKQLGEDRLVRGERGAVKRERNALTDNDTESSDFRPGATWSTVSKTVKIEFKKERDLNKEKLTSEGIVEISFELASPDGVLYLDDVKLVPAP